MILKIINLIHFFLSYHIVFLVKLSISKIHTKRNIMSDVSGTALFLEQNKILNEISNTQGENAANYTLAFTLSEVTGKEHLPSEAQNFRDIVNVMMNNDLQLQEASKILENGRKQITEVLTSTEDANT